LSKTIIQQDTVSEQMLTTKSFQLPHFFLISDQNKKQFLSNSYLKKIVTQWNEDFPYSSQTQLPLFSYFQAAYLTDQYAKIDKFYMRLKNNQLFPNSSLKLRLYRYIDYSIYRLGYYDQNLTLTRNTLLPLSRYLNDDKSELSIKKLYGVYL